MELLGKDKAMWGLARVGGSAAALYALGATLAGSDPTAAAGDIAATQGVLETVVDLIYKLIEQWPLVVAAVLPLWSKFSGLLSWTEQSS